ncbi:baseplate J/gp47 family protein [Clostridium butyricum]
MAETKESLIATMLSKIDSSYDTSEGTFFFDVLMPIAIELEKMYKYANSITDKGFADTATGKDLDRIVEQFGINRKKSTKSTGYVEITGLSGSRIFAGEKVASDSISFIFLENKTVKDKVVTVLVECETYGIDGNVPAGAIKYFPKTLQGLQSVTNKEAFTNGYDEETDEELRERYYIKVRTPATSGNIYHYQQWCLEVTGVGGCRIFPLWNGNGTVKCVIMDYNKKAADDSLINSVKEHIEENRPIGADVTVTSVLEKAISINVKLSIESGYSKDFAKEKIENSLNECFESIAFKKNYISYAKIGAIILSCEGIEDYTDLLVNNGISNINITEEEVCVLGGLEIE